MSVINRK